VGATHTVPGRWRRANATYADEPELMMSGLTDERAALVFAFLESYLSWREACEDVWSAYRGWVGCQPQQRRLGFAAYQSALDREERVARIHCEWAARAGSLAR
jgi:hypothetical protein